METEKIKIGFLGYGTRALDALMEHDKFDVRYFLAPRSRLCQDVYDAAERYKDRLTLEIVDNGRMLAERLARMDDVECFLMNACPIILKQDVLDLMPFYNIHPGDLRYNRGHQPHMWTVLLGERVSKIVLHEVCTGIDEGQIVRARELEIAPEMDSGEVLDYLEDQIPYLLDGLYEHLKCGAPYEERIMGGSYRPVMKHSDYRVDFQEAQSENEAFCEDMDRKMRARSFKNGAFFVHEGKRVYFNRILEKERVNGTNRVEIDEEEGRILVETNAYRFVLALKKIEDNTED